MPTFYAITIRFKDSLMSFDLRASQWLHRQLHEKDVGAMHFIYYINRLIATKIDSTYLG